MQHSSFQWLISVLFSEKDGLSGWMSFLHENWVHGVKGNHIKARCQIWTFKMWELKQRMLLVELPDIPKAIYQAQLCDWPPQRFFFLNFFFYFCVWFYLFFRCILNKTISHPFKTAIDVPQVSVECQLWELGLFISPICMNLWGNQQFHSMWSVIFFFP